MRETLTIIGLAIGSLCLAYIFVSLERMRKVERAAREAEQNARIDRMLRCLATPTYEANYARIWQSIQDRLAVDALVGPSTYEGGE